MPRLALIVLYCGDVPKCRDFYQALGFEFHIEKHGEGPVHYATSVGDMFIELYPASDSKPVSMNRLEFVVEDIHVVVARLQSIPCLHRYPSEGILSCKDPDDRVIVVRQKPA